MSPPDDTARAERLAAALRENLKRRKSQAKGRVVPPAGEPGKDTDPASQDASSSDEGEGSSGPAR